MNVDMLYPDQAVVHGTGVAVADTTAGQFVYVTADDEYTVQTNTNGLTAGVCYTDTLAGALIPVIVPPAVINFATIAGGAAAGDEIEIDTDGFPTKLAAGIARGVIQSDSDGFVVRLYGI